MLARPQSSGTKFSPEPILEPLSSNTQQSPALIVGALPDAGLVH